MVIVVVEVEKVAAWLAAGGNVDARAPQQGNTMLMYGTTLGHAPLVTTLLRHRARSDIRNSDGETALSLAQSKEQTTAMAAIVALLQNDAQTGAAPLSPEAPEWVPPAERPKATDHKEAIAQMKAEREAANAEAKRKEAEARKQ